ncbi:MAG: hypothetical protein WAN51_09005 [Alphaproteobacteria bacterium]
MSALTAFEVQSFRNGDWKIDTITDSKDLAVHQAEQVILHPGIRKVRVVQEAFDPASAGQKFRTVFFRDKDAVCKPPAPSAAPGAPAAETAQAAPTARPSLKAPRRAGAVGLILKFALIISVGIAAILALRYFGANL